MEYEEESVFGVPKAHEHIIKGAVKSTDKYAVVRVNIDGLFITIVILYQLYIGQNAPWPLCIILIVITYKYNREKYLNGRLNIYKFNWNPVGFPAVHVIISLRKALPRKAESTEVMQ